MHVVKNVSSEDLVFTKEMSMEWEQKQQNVDRLAAIKLTYRWMESLETDAILQKQMQMEIHSLTLHYMEHKCCLMSLPFHTSSHHEYLISLLAASPLDIWRFLHWTKAQWFVHSSLFAQGLSLVLWFFLPQRRHAVWLFCWLCRGVRDNAVLPLPSLLILDPSSAGQEFMSWFEVGHEPEVA